MKKILLMVGMLLASTSVFANWTPPSTTYYWCQWDNAGHTNIVTTTTNVAPTNSVQATLVNGQYTCPNAEKPGCDLDGSCPSISDSAYFDFKIESGGYDADVYVCQVCLRDHVCTNCGEDKLDTVLVKDDKYNTIGTLNGDYKCKDFTKQQNARYGQVLLNSIEYGSGWSVKYCLDLIHGVAGGTTYNNFKTYLKVNGGVTITPGAAGPDNNGYLSESQLSFSVSHRCGDSVTQYGDILDGANNLWDEILDHPETISTEKFVCVSETGSGCFTKKDVCSWTVNFQETKRCPRRLKDSSVCKNGDVECELFKGKINTAVTATIKPTCANCPR